MIKNYILLSFLVAYMSVIAQRMAISEDSIIKIQTQIFEPDWISYTNKDTLFLYVNEKIQKTMIAPDSLLYSWEFPILASNYFREGKELAQLMAQPPVPIALEKINDSTYLFLGYRRFRSPVTIL